MNKVFKIIILLTLTIWLTSFFVVVFYKYNFSSKLDIKKVCFGQNCFRVEIAERAVDLEKGLMFRNYLEKDRGMLFVFENSGNYPFWMKNTLIPLDIIWINKNNEIVFIKEKAEPCPPSPKATEGQVKEVDCPIIDPEETAKYVLEINGGLVKEMNIKVGDKVSF